MQMSLEMFSMCRMLSLLRLFLLHLALPERELKRTPCDVTSGVAVPCLLTTLSFFPLPNMCNLQKKKSFLLAAINSSLNMLFIFLFFLFF